MSLLLAAGDLLLVGGSGLARQTGAGPPESAYDGPAELPRVTPSFTPPTTWTPRVTHTPTTGAQLQTLLTGGTLNGQTLQRGDWIVLQSGTQYTSSQHKTFVFPALTGAFDPDDWNTWVWVRPSNYALLPPSGTRVTAADIPNMANFANVQDDLGPMIYAANDSSGYIFTGIESRRSAPSPLNIQFVWFGWHETIPGAGLPESAPTHLVLDRCYCKYEDTLPAWGVRINARWGVIQDCHIDVGAPRTGGVENQAIEGISNVGPTLIKNNCVIAGGENIMFGGDDKNGWNPCDMTIVNNYVLKPYFWNPYHAQYDGLGSRMVKNLFELKKGIRVLIEHNVFQHTWNSGQAHAIVLKSANQSGSDPGAQSADVTFRWNKVLEVVGALNIVSDTYGGNGVQFTERISIHDVLFTGLQRTDLGFGAGGEYPKSMTLGGKARNIVMANVTMCPLVNLPGMAWADSESAATNGSLTIHDSIFHHGNYGFYVSPLGEGLTHLAVPYNAGLDVRGNLIVDTEYPSLYNGTANAYPATPDAVFVDAANGNWTVKAPYTTSGYAGGVPGVSNLAYLDTVTAGCVSGDWS